MTSSRIRRIAYLCDFNAHGGTQTHLLHLLAGLSRKRFEPSLVTLTLHPDLAGRLREGGIAVRDLALRGAFTAATARKVLALARALRRDPPDLLHGYLHPGNILAAALSTVTGIPCMTSVRNRDLWKRGRHRRLGALAHRRAIRVVFNSEVVREETMAAESIPREKTVVIPNGVPPVAEAWRGGGGATLICVASLREKKGHPHLLEAFQRVRRRRPEARLLIAGEGPLRASLEEQVRAMGLAGAVELTGYRADVGPLLASADLFVMASLEEGMPNALLEAMSAALPAVVTAVGGNREVVEDGKTGFLVEPADPAAMADRILAVLEQPGRARSMGEAARRRFEERFSLDRMIAAYEDLYEGALR